MTISILGTDYEIVKKRYEDEPEFKERSIDGYCDDILHQIVFCDMSSYPDWKNEKAERIRLCEQETLRHEIVHAFFDESGLKGSTFEVNGPWAKNEELVDWIAIQGPKIYAAWKKAKAI